VSNFSVTLQADTVRALNRIAEALEKGNEIAAESLALQKVSVRIMEQNSKANYALHLELTEALNEQSSTPE
jgi:predicted transcriptional regulator